MALIKCNECGKEISDKAKSCIHCGYRTPPPKLSKLDKIFIPIIAIAIFGGLMGLVFSPSLVKHYYPNMKVHTTYDNNGLIGYDSNGNEIRGHTSKNRYDLGEMETDYSKAIVVGTLSVVIPTISIVTYTVLKKKENKSI